MGCGMWDVGCGRGSLAAVWPLRAALQHKPHTDGVPPREKAAGLLCVLPLRATGCCHWKGEERNLNFSCDMLPIQVPPLHTLFNQSPKKKGAAGAHWQPTLRAAESEDTAQRRNEVVPVLPLEFHLNFR